MKACLILIAIGSLSGCSCALHYAIGLPERPLLEPLEAELQAEIPAHTLKIIAENDLEIKQYAKQLEARILLHDEAID